MSEQLTSEETAAMAAMQADPGPEPTEVVDVPQETPAAVAAPVAETPAAEPVAEADKPPPGMVPQGALHQERERRKETERQFQELQRQFAEIQARLAPPPPEIVVPDPILDPQGFKQFQIDQIKQRAAEKAEAAQREQQTAQQQAIMARVTHDVAQFKATVPDYEPAFQHAVKVRREELAFYGNSPEQIQAQLEVDMQAIVQQAYSQGKNPGELFYGYAKMRGYSPAQAAAQPVPDPQAVAQVQALARAQQATATMGTAGGPSSDGGMTIEMLAKMSEKELAALPRAKRDEYMQKVMGG